MSPEVGNATRQRHSCTDRHLALTGTVALSDQMILTPELLRFRSRGVVVEPSIPEDEPQISSISRTWNAAQPNYFRRQDHGIG
jgi:hypothetical protein